MFDSQAERCIVLQCGVIVEYIATSSYNVENAALWLHGYPLK